MSRRELRSCTRRSYRLVCQTGGESRSGDQGGVVWRWWECGVV